VRALTWLHALPYTIGLRTPWQAPVPVVVVGNVIVGGAGKTPVVMALAEHWRAHGLQVGVVSRGYGRSTRDCREVHPDSDPADVGDEPLLIRRRAQVPVFVAQRRADAAQALLAAYPHTEVLLCDDGLQHRALARDVEICVFDDRGVGNGLLLPAGPLREPWPRPVDLILHTGARPAPVGQPGFGALRKLAAHAVDAEGQTLELASFAARSHAGTPVLAVAGLARPEAFFDMLESCGVRLMRTEARPDHDDYAGWTPPREPGALVLCTEKDAAKLWSRWPQAWAVPLEFAPEPAFFAALDAHLARVCSRRGLRPLSSRDGHPTA